MKTFRAFPYASALCLAFVFTVIPAAGAGIAADTEGELVTEVVEYVPVKLERISCATGVVYRVHENGMTVEVASMATGKGADFRKWKVADTKLKVGGEYLRPSTTQYIYGARESIFRVPAAVVFAAIGSQYERYASSCSESGGVCPVTGRTAGGGARPEQSGISKGIDKVGMAVGMGLLASQARGEITGQKSVFELTKEQAQKLEGAKVVVENTGDSKKETIDVPLSGMPADEAAELFRNMAKKQPAMEHKAGVPAAGTFVVVTEDKGEKK